MGFLFFLMDLGLLGRGREVVVFFRFWGERGFSLVQFSLVQGVFRGSNSVLRFYGMTWGLCCKQESGCRQRRFCLGRYSYKFVYGKGNVVCSLDKIGIFIQGFWGRRGVSEYGSGGWRRDEKQRFQGFSFMGRMWVVGVQDGFGRGYIRSVLVREFSYLYFFFIWGNVFF